ncbi:transcriptional regulator, TetR family [Methylocella silvestris BL2]|uniref:Transcriptional regulator, TetR family n=1 Tax=Methylocella silvestris (strain DSM 15510 / CIP 108128 / LMG 27833 / NCIMB 13906 / BL2) TaxID=395965 RepID=B8ESA3_METSB|nr:TetR/AcrR family transcriptional regulator [Methylocella silvestris]ACK52318.1 transcriptional regulator, TetR family [Methylocella silvestris BL2]
MVQAEPGVRTPTAKGSDRVETILIAAKDILVKQGFANLSYRNIAKGAGIAVGNVNYYYPSKDNLMVDLAHYIFDRWDHRFRRRVPAKLKDDREIFKFSIEFMISENQRDRTVSLLMEMWTMANHSPAVSKMLGAFYQKMRAWISGMIERAKPDLSRESRDLRAALITAQIEGLMILIGPKRVRYDELVGLERVAVTQIERLAFED